MSSSPPVPNFPTYLTCDLPAGYPFDTPFWLPQPVVLKESVRRELVRQQATFLEVAEQVVGTHPWLAYLAALKHEAVIALTPIESIPFIEIAEQKFYNDTRQRWRQVKREARAGLDEPTAFFCERLILLQREGLKIDEAVTRMEAAINAGFTALDPNPPPPPPEIARGLFGGFEIEPAKDDEAQAARKAWALHETYLGVCQVALKAVNSLPARNKHDMLRDLPACVAALKELREERAALLATYVTPYFG